MRTLQVAAKTTASAGPDDPFGSIQFSIDAQNDHGCTLLMKAAAAGQLSLIQWFVRVGASVATCSLQGRTALHFAAESGWVEAVVFLCDHGADPAAADAAGVTPAALASTRNHIECVQYLWQRHNLVGCGGARAADKPAAAAVNRESKRARTAMSTSRGTPLGTPCDGAGSVSPPAPRLAAAAGATPAPAAEPVDDPDDYTLRFVAARLEAGATATDVLAEFQVPRSRWPPSAPDRPASVESLRDTVVLWLSEPEPGEGEGQGQESGADKDGGAASGGGNVAVTQPAVAEPVALVPTDWVPARAAVALNVELDVVGAGAQRDASHIVVLDDFFERQHHDALLSLLCGAADYDQTRGPNPTRWVKKTCDSGGAVKIQVPEAWGLTGPVLKQLATHPAVLEIQSRLCETASKTSFLDRFARIFGTNPKPILAALYPEHTISHIPRERLGANGYVADPYVANAPVAGDRFQWHIDADPATWPTYGNLVILYGNPQRTRFSALFCLVPVPMACWYGHTNRTPGKPYFVTLLIYLVGAWQRCWDAETFFLDTLSETGVFVRPKQFRAVLMDQDVSHRLSAPSELAEGRPRYSLVWKLIFVPRKPGQIPATISRPEWGPPTTF